MKTTLKLKTEGELNKRIRDNEKRGWSVTKRGVWKGEYGEIHWATMERKD